MIGAAWWQALLDGLGWFLAKIYDLVPNYGVAIILLTVAIRVVLLPLGIKQIRAMHSMQAIQPQMKAIQQKYKGNRQKQNEEIMKLYREHGVNPFSGCWPMLLQFPILIALYAVLRYPVPEKDLHLPEGSALRERIVSQEGTDFLWTNLLCSAQQAGHAVQVKDKQGKVLGTLECGESIPARIPYYVLALLMIGTTYYQQRQMQKATPAGQQSQQQTLTRVMPILFGVWGFLFPSGLVLYWTTSNMWQIGQQHFMLRARGPGPAVVARPGGPRTPRGPTGPGKPREAKKGWLASLTERAERDRAARGKSPPGGRKRPGGKDGDRKKRRKR